MSELRQLAEESLGAIAEPTFTYAEVRREYIAAKVKLGVRVSFKEFMKQTKLDKQIFRLGKHGGTRLLLKDDVIDAFKKIMASKHSDLDKAKKAYKAPNSALKKYNGKLLGYALKFGSRKGGDGKDARKLRHKLDSYEMREEIHSALRKLKRDTEIENLEALRERAGKSVPKAPPKKTNGK